MEGQLSSSFLFLVTYSRRSLTVKVNPNVSTDTRPAIHASCHASAILQLTPLTYHRLISRIISNSTQNCLQVQVEGGDASIIIDTRGYASRSIDYPYFSDARDHSANRDMDMRGLKRALIQRRELILSSPSAHLPPSLSVSSSSPVLPMSDTKRLHDLLPHLIMHTNGPTLCMKAHSSRII